MEESPATVPFGIAMEGWIETERLWIRPAAPGDGAAFNAAIRASLEHLAPWLAWVTPPPEVEVSEESCRKAWDRWRRCEDLMVFFFLKDGGDLVGGSGLHDPDWAARVFEVGYWGHRSFSGQGLMTEGVRALAEHAFAALAANRVYLTTDARNTASWRLAERAGFELEGTLRNERLDLAGRLRDTRVYARVRQGWLTG